MDKNKTLGLFLVLLIIILVGLVYYYLNLGKGPAEAPVAPAPAEEQLPTKTPSPTVKVVEVPFDYEIVSISETQVIMTGERGEIAFPNDERVRVFFGAPPNDKPATFADFKVGQKIKLNMVPGKAAWVYILQ